MANQLVPRPRNVDWRTWREDGGFKHEQILEVLLMDIRDELQMLNRVFQCPNFLAIPGILRGINVEMLQVRRNTTKKRKKRAVKK